MNYIQHECPQRCEHNSSDSIASTEHIVFGKKSFLPNEKRVKIKREHNCSRNVKQFHFWSMDGEEIER